MDAFKRLFEATGCHTQNQLAHLLGIRQSSISDAMRRNSIPAAWLVALVRTRGISPEWIITGSGSKYLAPVDEVPLNALSFWQGDVGEYCGRFASWGWLLVRFGVVYPDKLKKMIQSVEEAKDVMLPYDQNEIVEVETLATLIREMTQRVNQMN